MLDTWIWWVASPFEYAFMRRALAACLVLSLTAPLLGVLLSLRGLSLMSEALHLGLPAGPAIVLLAGAGYLVSVLVGPYGGLLWRQAGRRQSATVSGKPPGA
jgi:zinc/manganese transport system permease protein